MAVEFSRWKLPAGLIALSREQRWPQVLSEWQLARIEYLEVDEPSETCLCHHYPIREICHISNIVNRNTAIVGNCCVTKFEREEYAFTGIHKIFVAFKKIKEDLSASANTELIEYAFQRGIIDEKGRKFYLDIWRKRTSVTYRQLCYKQFLNDKIIKHLSGTRSRPATVEDVAVVDAHMLSVSTEAAAAHAVAQTTLQAAFFYLQSHPSSLASERLIAASFKKDLITGREYNFYMSFFAKHITCFSEKQQSWINDINQKILTDHF